MTWLQHIKSLLDRLREDPAALAIGGGGGCLIVIIVATFGGWNLALLVTMILLPAVGLVEIVRQLRRIADSSSGMADTLADIQTRLERLQRTISAHDTRKASSATTTVDLATFGKGQPDRLAAASLDRDAFPRLMTMMETVPPAESSSPPVEPTPAADHVPGAAHEKEVSPPAGVADSRVSQENLFRAWKVGLRYSDLELCRNVYGALVDTLDAESLAPLEVQLVDLADRTERSLREAFAAHRKRHDVRGMLTVGGDICKLLGDRSIADEFRRVETQLQRLAPPDPASKTPPLRLLQ